MTEKVYNFAAGPAVLPELVLKTAQSELLNWRGSGMSVMEMSHRGAEFGEIFESAKQRFKKLLSVPDSHEVLFLQGGATTQFAAVPLNLMGTSSASYAVTGNFSGIAAKEAEKYGAVSLAFDGGGENFTRIPLESELKIDPDVAYFHYCSNNTIFGTAWDYVPETGGVNIVCDMSSEIMSKPVDVSKFGLIYAGAQKNIAPAGLTIVVIDKTLAGHERAYTPQMLSYKKMIDKDSMPNTPPCWCIYMLGLVLDWVEAEGGVAGMSRRKKQRSALIYDVLDNSRLYKAHAALDSRSDMNITFRTGSQELDAEFVRGAKSAGLLNVKGHRLTGGMRASLYNAMPLEGAQALAEYMKKFEVLHGV